MPSILGHPSAKRLLACLLFAIQATSNTMATAQSESSETNQQTVARLVAEAGQAYDQRDFELSVERYSAAMDHGEESSTAAYNAACSASLAGEADRAFEFLGMARERGWIDSRHLKRDPDLKPLHKDPRWDTSIVQFEAAKKLNDTRWQSKAFETPYADNLSDAEKVAGLSKLWAEVKFNFVNFHLVPKLDWDAEYVACLPQVLETTSTLEYYRLLEKLVAQLHDGHTNVFLPTQLHGAFDARPGFQTRLIDGKVYVVSISDSAIQDSGIEVGQELLKIDGVPVMEHAQQNIEPYMTASTPQDLATRTYGSSLMRGPLKKKIAIEVAQPDGTQIKMTVSRQAQNRLVKYMSGPPAFELEMLEGNLAHVKLNSFGTIKASTDFANAFDKLSKADGMILDVRQNGGGNSSVGWTIIGFLTDKPFQTTRWHTLQYRPTFRAWNRQPLSQHGAASGTFSADTNHHYQKPVVMLIGPKTFSAAEDMVAAFDMLDRGKIIGQATGGSTGQPLMFPLPGGGTARVCTKHDSYADGTEFVGKGIQPDIEITPTIDDIRNQRDRALEAAAAELRK